MESFHAVITETGARDLMQSEMAKITHGLCGKPVINWVLDAVREAGADEITVITDQDIEQIAACVSENVTLQSSNDGKETNIFIKAAHFLECKKGVCLFSCADNPLITAATISHIVEDHRINKRAVTILSCEGMMPDACCNNSDDVSPEICEQRFSIEANEPGIFCIDIDWLKAAAENNSCGTIQGIISYISGNGGVVGTLAPYCSEELFRVNDRVELSLAHDILNRRIINRHMMNGVTFLKPGSCIIEYGVTIGRDTIIYPGTILEGNTSVGTNCTIGPDSTLRNTVTGNHVNIINSVVIDSSVGDNTKVGPFAYLRPGSMVGRNVKIGDFVEIKKSSIGDDTKISHLTYVGDAEIGRNVNLGCGVVVVNYDGQKKHKTIVGDNSFIGCNVNLVSPVEVKQNAFIAAGSTITEEVPEYSLAIARSRQSIIKDWVLRKGRLRETKT